VRRILFVLALAACTPTATAPTPGLSAIPSASVAAPTAATTVTAAPTVVIAPSVSTVVPAATPAPTAAAPTPEPATPSPAPQAIASPNDIHNDGQTIVASFATPLAWFFGEGGGSPATGVQNYRLNGVSLARSSLRCTKQISVAANNGCAALAIVPAIRLVNGVTYELDLLDEPLGEFTVAGLSTATPHVLDATATQYTLTVTFDRPMLHVGDCGTSSFALSTPGTIEFVRGLGPFPAPPGDYTSTRAGYRDFLASFISQADLSPDCRAVTFGSGWGSVTGAVDLIVAGVEDVDGNYVEPVMLPLTITDDAAPRLMFADVELQNAQKKVIRVAFSEAMDEATVRDASHYRLNNSLIPATTVFECEIASCTWVRLTFAPSTFTYGANNTLTVSDVRDLAGKTLDPATSRSGAFQVY
jgi:hypothetical protein